MADITPNLKLTKINSSDYISPDPINDAFDIIDGLGKIYITEAGDSDGWHYIKFSNGFVFYSCFVGRTTVEGQSSYNLKKNYPTPFSSAPVLVASAGASGVVGAGVHHVGQSVNTADIWMDTVTTDGGRDYWFSLMAFGKVTA